MHNQTQTSISALNAYVFKILYFIITQISTYCIYLFFTNVKLQNNGGLKITVSILSNNNHAKSTLGLQYGKVSSEEDNGILIELC